MLFQRQSLLKYIIFFVKALSTMETSLFCILQSHFYCKVSNQLLKFGF